MTIPCACCQAATPIERGKRIVCIECGADFGMLHEGPIKIVVRENVDMFLVEVAGRLAVIERLMESA